MADFKTAVLLTVNPAHEGGFQKDPQDHANWTGNKIGVGELKGTKYGVTAADLPDTDIENLTVDQAIEFYRDKYWKPLYSQIESQPVANKIFDMGVLFGVGEAIKLLQISLQPTFPHIHPDGIFGNETLSTLNQVEENSLLSVYKTALVAYTLRIAVAKPEEKKNVAGWGKRINS
jgi:lysozyme family protein